MQEMFNKDLEEIKKSQYIMNNAINEKLLPTAEKYGKHHIAIAGVIAGMAIMGVSLLIL